MKKLYIAIALIILIIGSYAVTTLFNTPSSDVAPKKIAGSYIALGDSVAAGVGLDDYSDSSACDRTTQAYPNLVAPRLSYSLTSVACSGASTSDGLVGSQTVNQLTLPAQLSSLNKNAKPNLITMTIGINDTDWTSYIQKCYMAECGSEADTQRVQAATSTAMTNLSSALRTISALYDNNPPQIVLTDYYALFPTNLVANCNEGNGLSANELAWIARLQVTINQSLQATIANEKNVIFAPIDFSGHELCSSASWVQGLNDKAPFHPTVDGQKAIANQLLTVIRSREATK